ncbi:flagellar biosynthetic protein FliR [Caballeronia sp. GAWG2-1]|uniref:flagellar biosynthetic protein FliR n=1 Tax=Caballeronia sp. GAWG2-1 TaxID=2921744 RepID=UPI0020279EB0|nr:flagellar biosynthetic protein FliR [Caballeronia sp. GAWG2-1]
MNILDQLSGFAFCMIRPAVALALIPFGNDGALGVTLRAPLVLIFAVLPAQAGLPHEPLAASVMEAGIGLLLGLGFGVVFHAASTAGAILDQQGGYSVGAVYDPNFEQESAAFQTLFTQFAAFTLFTGHGLVALCGVFADAWSIWPPGGPYPGGLARLLAMFSETRLPQSLAQGLQISAPLLALMLLADVSLGLASRHAKRLNPFSTARTFKAMVLSFALMACVPAILDRLARIFAVSLNLE